jgi:hypothetical protein
MYVLGRIALTYSGRYQPQMSAQAGYMVYSVSRTRALRFAKEFLNEMTLAVGTMRLRKKSTSKAEISQPSKRSIRILIHDDTPLLGSLVIATLRVARPQPV